MALVGAGWYGWAGSSTALAVNGTSVSDNAFRAELHAFATNKGLYCYISSLANVAIGKSGAGRDSVAVAGEAAWANLRVEGIAIEEYVTQYLHYHASAADLTQATTSLEDELSQAATQTSNACPGTPAEALAAMPAEMRNAQILDQADSVYLVSKLNKTIPLTTANIKKYYEAHLASFETVCVSVAVVLPANVTAFAAGEAQGLSVSALAKKYSVDASAAKGGAVGCYGPTSTYYASVVADIGTTKIGHYSAPRAITSNGSQYALYFAPTSKSVTPLAQAQGVVISDIQSNNSANANTVKANILYASAVVVDPSLGRWGLATSGPSIFVPNLPSESGPATTTQLTAASTLPYQ